MDRLKKLVSGSLRRPSIGPHPGAEMLAAFAENALSRPERQQTIEHLAACADCREILYFAQPGPASAQTPVYRPNPATHFVLRWGAVAASLVIVAGGLFITRHDFFPSKQKDSQQPAPVYYDKLAEKKSPPELDSVRNAEAATPPKQLTTGVTKTRPAEKHMTAKPKANMSFDDSGQVRLMNREESPKTPSPVDADDVIAQAGKPGKQRDDSASANTPSSATAAYAGGDIAENKIDSKDMPHPSSESVEVSAAAPEVQNERAVGTRSAKLEASQPKQSDTRAFKQNGALLKALGLPVAQWEISSAGEVRRSFDAGKTWQSVSVNGSPVRFRAVFSSGPQVWVGGSAGALYRSTDSGLTWMQIVPAAGGQKLQSDVRHIEFSDPQTGAVTASNGETWSTSDGGQTWRRK